MKNIQLLTFFLLLMSVRSWSSKSCNNKNCLLESDTSGKQDKRVNIDGGALKVCSKDPLTGYTRSGYCDFSPSDRGEHFVCAEVSAEFLSYTKKMGNDLSTPNPRYGFKGLVPGDRWCLCVSRVIEANKSGIPLQVIRSATHIKSNF